MLDTHAIDEKFADLDKRVDALTRERDEAARERDEYKRLYMKMLELCRKLELGIVGQKRERFVG